MGERHIAAYVARCRSFLGRRDDCLMTEPSPSAGLLYARCEDGVVTLDMRSDRYCCHYDPTEIGVCNGPAILDSPVRNADEPIKPGDVARFVLALIRCCLFFPRRSVAALLLQSTKTQKDLRALPASSTKDFRSAVATARQFERLCLWLPFRPACLFRSYFLLDYLGRYRLSADWVFGVRLFPFRAHCWLEVDSWPLDERPDAVAMFTPIFVYRSAKVATP